MEAGHACRAYLYDATAADREVTLDAPLLAGLTDAQLLWVMSTASKNWNCAPWPLQLKRESVYNLLQPDRRPAPGQLRRLPAIQHGRD